MRFDELNRLEEDYFEPMAISADDKARRRELAGLLADVFIYFFALYDVHRQHDSLLDKARYEQLLSNTISDAVSKVTGIDAYISNHIRTLSKEVVETTIEHVDKQDLHVRQDSPTFDDHFIALDAYDESLGTTPLSISTSDSHFQDEEMLINADEDEVEEIIEDNATANYWLSVRRAINIAQNESNTFLNYTDFMDAKDRGCTQKSWMTMMDDRVRDTHEEAEGELVGIDDYFIVGNSEMRFPHDLSLSPDPKEVINCRCSVEYK